ncbi:DUF2993 domain-containing protein [Actinomadura sp. 7K507]|uniref:LmeA family phospholipid-binding protein n=1 Tax=Actinomadura sp. 7K507 TaxID=2530365 RepID=UPI001404E2EE|nr:DUF2993 domain-containing protein [Actinomadura sp. 7K507]
MLVALVDRGGAAFAERRMATEIRKEGFPVDPEVTIKGIPFLTQAVSRDFRDVRLKASDIRRGALRITALDVRARGVHLDPGYRSGVLGTVDGTAFIGFGDLAKAGGNPALELTQGTGDQVNAKIDLGLTQATAAASVTKEGDGIRVRALSLQGLPLNALGGALDFTVPVRGLPLGLAFQSLAVTSDGVELRVTGKDVRFDDR